MSAGSRAASCCTEGSTDLEVAAALEITKEEWLEVRKVCSGPPLELKEQAKPTDPLEPSEIDFAKMYLEMALKRPSQKQMAA